MIMLTKSQLHTERERERDLLKEDNDNFVKGNNNNYSDRKSM